MIAVDSNVLVYAHREDSPWHEAAYSHLLQLAEGRAPWAIPWSCIHEFLAMVTHTHSYATPTPLETAINQVEAWMGSPSLVLLSKSEYDWTQLRDVIQAECRARSSMMHESPPYACSTGSPNYGQQIGTLADFQG